MSQKNGASPLRSPPITIRTRNPIGATSKILAAIWCGRWPTTALWETNLTNLCPKKSMIIAIMEYVRKVWLFQTIS